MIRLLAFALLLALTAVARGEGQLGAPLEWIRVPDSNGARHLAQRSRDGRLVLTPNEAFFPKLGLTATGRGSVPDVMDLNGGSSFDA
ncbi:MAG: hypothetical protein KDK99_11300, partial [Verrucomicrobiales bacterium]|nr:hypothetical protein [Verrucomicrobiales bacterium]